MTNKPQAEKVENKQESWEAELFKTFSIDGNGTYRHDGNGNVVKEFTYTGIKSLLEGE